MIACENDNCSIEWFHTKCLKMKVIPKGKNGIVLIVESPRLHQN